jgi:hypothetical protein
MYRRLLAVAVLFAVSLVAVSGRSEQPNQVAPFMKLKLGHAQTLLEGIALEDFASIEKNAQQLSLLSQDERWQILQTPAYLQYSIEFRRTADELGAAARKQNLDGTALAYVALTLKCVECHKHVRDVRRASLDDLKPTYLGGLVPRGSPAK